jgi:hypothetical protein
VTIAAAELFAAELALGADALDEATRDHISHHLLEVMATRNFPLHTTIAWNALHFGFDPVALSYQADLLGADMPVIELGGAVPAVPVGALAWVHVGGHEGAVWAEVVGKDGRPDGVDDNGVCRRDVSGASAPDGPDGVRLREALIVDFAAFGPVVGIDRRLDRLRRRGRLDRHGLVLVDAGYDSTAAADDPDVWFYARWLFDHQRHLLRAGPLAATLADPDDDDALRDALMASVDAVADILATTAGVARWGDYWFPAEWLDDIDATPNLPLHRFDLDHLVVSLAVPPETDHVAYTALSPRLSEYAGMVSAPADRPDAVLPDPMGSTGYLRVVATTSRWMADELADRGGVVTTNSGRWHLRADDRWPWGGVWRTQRTLAGHPLLNVPVDVPLAVGARGWADLAEYLGVEIADVEAAVADAEASAAEPPDEHPGEEQAPAEKPPEENLAQGSSEEEGEAVEPDDVETTLIGALVTLRQVDIDDGTLAIPESCGWLLDGAPVTVVVSHAGDIDDDQRSQDAKAAADGGPRLEGLWWPMDFFGGIRLHLGVFASGRIVFGATQPLDEPVVVDGVEYRFAFDPAVVGATYHTVAVTLSAIAVAALARHGRVAADNTRRATAGEVSVFCYGPGRPDPLIAAVRNALDEAVDARRITLAGSEYVWSPRAARPPRRSAPLGWERHPVERAAVRAHWVPGFIRWLPPGWRASEEKKRSYRLARAERRVIGPPQLPDGATWVEGHERGSRSSAYTAALYGVISFDGREPDVAEQAALAEDWEGGR